MSENKERTRGMLDFLPSGFGSIAVYADRPGIGMPFGSKEKKHAVACWNAIEAVGGDPGMVERMRKATGALACISCTSWSEKKDHATCCPTCRARAILDEIKEAQS